MPKMRLYGTPDEVEETISLLYTVLIVRSVSRHYANGDASSPGTVRVYVDYELPADET